MPMHTMGIWSHIGLGPGTHFAQVFMHGFNMSWLVTTPLGVVTLSPRMKLL